MDNDLLSETITVALLFQDQCKRLSFLPVLHIWLCLLKHCTQKCLLILCCLSRDMARAVCFLKHCTHKCLLILCCRSTDMARAVCFLKHCTRKCLLILCCRSRGMARSACFLKHCARKCLFSVVVVKIHGNASSLLSL